MTRIQIAALFLRVAGLLILIDDFNLLVVPFLQVLGLGNDAYALQSLAGEVGIVTIAIGLLLVVFSLIFLPERLALILLPGDVKAEEEPASIDVKEVQSLIFIGLGLYFFVTGLTSLVQPAYLVALRGLSYMFRDANLTIVQGLTIAALYMGIGLWLLIWTRRANRHG